MHKLSELSDYPAIKKLASALHQFDANRHGAAIMIGAGFSRSAAQHVGGQKKMPLWYEFSKRLLAELNPNETNISFSDPLRVAEEYRAYFGQAALNDQIRFEIDDDAWRTSDLYQSLLKLPWSEVMTTNWDTLLERAAKDVHSPYYTPVTKPSDLAWAPSPRIVKFHGTIGMTNTFIAAQEDYRTYPEKFAPFVNFARQVFIENELCLVGFSGDDPNFLHWAGWVRDHLAGHARKIYLVGALKLTAARRKHLESINIAPIDLWSAVQDIDDTDLRHKTAIELFLQALADEGKSKVEPHDWTPSNLDQLHTSADDHARKYKDHEYAATLLSNQLEALRKDRESYPGWLICPPSLLWRLKLQLTDPRPSPQNITALNPDDRAKLLYEIAWRHSITFDNLPPWLAETLLEVANPDHSCALSKHQQIEIAFILLKNSRWLNVNDELEKQAVELHIQVLNGILEKHTQYFPNHMAELAYHKAITARDRLDFATIEEVVDKVTGEDPVWKVRQASLLMDLGRFNDGKELIAKAYGELRENHRRDMYSIPILSRLTWTHWLLKAADKYNTTTEDLPTFAESKYRKWKCDPWTWFEHLQDKARTRQENYLKEQNPIEPLFDQGHYRDNSTNRTFKNDTPEFLLLDGLSRNVGVPLRSGGVNFLAGIAERLVLSGGIGAEMLDYIWAIRAASSETSPSIKAVFTRIGIACSSIEVVDKLIDYVLLALNYWRNQRSKGTEEQQSHSLSVLRVLLEVLARLVIRASPEKAQEIFRLAVSIGQDQDFQHHWLFDVIGHLLTHSLKSIPDINHGDLLTDALAFPLQSEIMGRDFPSWPNPIINHPNVRETYPGIETRISALISVINPNGSSSCTDALLRLVPLVKKENFLTLTEREKLAAALWGKTPDYKTLPNTGLYHHILLILPVQDANEVNVLVQRHIYEHGEDVLADTQKELLDYPSPEIRHAIFIYEGMANAAANRTLHMYPSPEQALRIFERLMLWRPWKNSENSFNLFHEDGQRERLTDAIGNALSYAIVPALAVESHNVKHYEELITLYREVEAFVSITTAFIYFAHINENIANAIEKLIRKALQSRDPREVSHAAIALQKWAELSDTHNSANLNNLISNLIVLIESGRTIGLQQLIWVAGELFKKNRLTAEQIATLIESIPNVFNAANYINIGPLSEDAISASSIRVECVKLANMIYSQHPDVALNNLLHASKTDALPEVRYAIDLKEY